MKSLAVVLLLFTPSFILKGEDSSLKRQTLFSHGVNAALFGEIVFKQREFGILELRGAVQVFRSDYVAAAIGVLGGGFGYVHSQPSTFSLRYSGPQIEMIAMPDNCLNGSYTYSDSQGEQIGVKNDSGYRDIINLRIRDHRVMLYYRVSDSLLVGLGGGRQMTQATQYILGDSAFAVASSGKNTDTLLVGLRFSSM